MVTRIQAASVQQSLPTAFKLFLLAVILAALLLSGLRPTQAGDGSLPANSAITDTPAPYLFKDLVSGSEGSSPSQLSVVNDLLFFRADFWLWKSDGTPDGTVAYDNSNLWTFYDPTLMGEVNGSLMVFALGGQYQSYCRLWKTDGTHEGTAQIHDFLDQVYNPGQLCGFKVVNDILFFFIFDGFDTLALWTSDGTHDGTHMVTEIPANVISPQVEWREVMDDQLYFLIPYELWKTDGTAEGTTLVKRFQEYSDRMVLFNDRLFISADDGDGYGHELWVSDGTPEGTTLFKDFNPAGEDSAPTFVGVMGDMLFLGAKDPTVGKELWITDGTPEGTTLVKDLNTGSMGSYPEIGGVLGSTLIFTALDSNFDGWLWRSDGTEEGTVRVVYDHTLEGWGFYPGDNVLYFEGYHPDSGHELWQTDGSAEGTFLVADIYTGPTSSYPGYFTTFGNKLFFSARDEDHGDEL